ncbi:hypothetical protein TPA0910_14820 [Streptomyces hygroscopicus subsp. sporocinereus]|uniref:Uncharacterized protein n=1 Tax=Streptomyces hygroscopicus TaxID=1912 RepID=A0ABQ3TUN9_STRHY|nr:hypothetical protein TPA0910_14820 [Streptomyces hygroscopicus]
MAREWSTVLSTAPAAGMADHAGEASNAAPTEATARIERKAPDTCIEPPNGSVSRPVRPPGDGGTRDSPHVRAGAVATSVRLRRAGHVSRPHCEGVGDSYGCWET